MDAQRSKEERMECSAGPRERMRGLPLAIASHGDKKIQLYINKMRVHGLKGAAGRVAVLEGDLNIGDEVNDLAMDGEALQRHGLLRGFLVQS